MKVITIGRNEAHNDIVVHDNKVSRNHLQMIMDDSGNFSVMDLNSTNGTYVNDRRIVGEVPLKVTDEVRIGNTVLPWQSYFGNRSNSRANTPVSPRTSVSNASDSAKQPSSDPTSKPWLKYVIIATAALMLAVGGVVVWKIVHKEQEPTPMAECSEVEQPDTGTSKIDLSKEQAALDELEKKQIENNEKKAKTELELEQAKRKAAETNSKEDKKKVNDLQKKLDGYDKNNIKIKQEKQALEDRISTLTKENEKLTKDLSDERAAKSKAQEAQKETARSLELTNQMQKILNQWNDSQALNFCKAQHINCEKDKARDMITKKFSSKTSNTEKEKMIKEMDDWSQKNIKGYKSIR